MMRTSAILLSVLGATAFAAPAHPKLNLGAALPSDAIKDISQYFNLLAQKTQEGRHMSGTPVCDLSTAQMPVDCKPLPRPRPLSNRASDTNKQK